MNSQKKSYKSSRAYSILEILVVLVIIGAVTSMGIFDSRELYRPAANGSDQVIGFYKQVRANAVYNTRSYRIQPSSATTVEVSYRNSCDQSSESWTTDSSLNFNLPEGSDFTSTSWSVCINSRGFPDNNVFIDIADSFGTPREVEVLLGGGVREV